MYLVLSIMYYLFYVKLEIRGLFGLCFAKLGILRNSKILNIVFFGADKQKDGRKENAFH